MSTNKANGKFFVPSDGLVALLKAGAGPLPILSYLLLAELTDASGEISKGGQATIMARFNVGKKAAREAITSVSRTRMKHKGLDRPLVIREGFKNFERGFTFSNERDRYDSWLINSFKTSRKIWLSKGLLGNKRINNILLRNPNLLNLLVFLLLNYNSYINGVHPKAFCLKPKVAEPRFYDTFVFIYAQDLQLFDPIYTDFFEFSDVDELRQCIDQLYQLGLIEIKVVALDCDPATFYTSQLNKILLLDTKSSQYKSERLPVLEHLDLISTRLGYQCSRRLRRYAAAFLDGDPSIVGLLRPVHVAGSEDAFLSDERHYWNSENVELLQLVQHVSTTDNLKEKEVVVPEELLRFGY